MDGAAAVPYLTKNAFLFRSRHELKPSCPRTLYIPIFELAQKNRELAVGCQTCTVLMDNHCLFSSSRRALRSSCRCLKGCINKMDYPMDDVRRRPFAFGMSYLVKQSFLSFAKGRERTIVMI
jgi:hypothetical protein